MATLTPGYARTARRSKALALAAVALLTAVALIAVRRGGQEWSFRNALRRCNRRWFNPLVLRLAGRVPFPLARLEHRGRSSGAPRATPVIAWRAPGGFVVPMPYGTDVDWARNVLHASDGMLLRQGVRYRVGRPRVAAANGASRDLTFPLGTLIARLPLQHVMRLDVLANPTPMVCRPA